MESLGLFQGQFSFLCGVDVSKVVKKQSKPTKAAKPVAVSMLDRSASSLALAIDALDACTERVATMLSEDYDVRTASHLAWLTDKVVRTRGELGKQAEREAKRSAHNLEEVLLRLRQLSPEDRAAVRDELERRNHHSQRTSSGLS